jgi:predicted dehydrogenase
MTSPVRLGLIGYGFGGRYFHAPLLGAAPGVDFLGVVTSSPARAQLATGETGRPTFQSLDTLVAAGAEAVAISTPAHSHIWLVEQALRRDLAVVCNKPFALDAVTARGAVELAVQLDVPLAVYQNRRWGSDFLTLRELITAGRLGEITRFESRFERYQPDPGPPAAGGGTLLDVGAHLVDQALTAFGPVASVYAEMHANAAGLDDDVFLALRHDSGVLSHFWGSWRQGAPGPRFRVTGTEASYVVGGIDIQEELLLGGASPASLGARWGVEPAERWGLLSTGDKQEAAPSARGAWDSFHPAVAAAVRGAGTLPVDAWDAVASTCVLDAARTSATTGQAVAVDAP